MKSMLMLATVALAVVMSSTVAVAHDQRLHAANAVTGEVVSASAEGLQLKTKTATVTIKYSSKTKFEHDKQEVDKSHVKTGERAGVIGSKFPTGEVMTHTVIVGLPAPKQATESKK